MNYHWEKLEASPGSEWTAVSGAVYSTLTIPAVALEDDGAKFRCLVTNIFGQSISNEAVLTVAKRIYVNASATGGDNGTSWASAYTDLQDALARTTEGFEIWVAVGSYKPTDDSDRSKSFELKEGVSLYGGFAGNETELDQRNPEQNETILSGDIGVPDDISDNSYNVITVFYTDDEKISILDGFKVEFENADGSGGLCVTNYKSLVSNELMIKNCLFQNKDPLSGGKIAIGDGIGFIQVIIEDSTIKNTDISIKRGELTLTNCNIDGGETFLWYSSYANIDGCIFNNYSLTTDISCRLTITKSNFYNSHILAIEHGLHNISECYFENSEIYERDSGPDILNSRFLGCKIEGNWSYCNIVNNEFKNTIFTFGQMDRNHFKNCIINQCTLSSDREGNRNEWINCMTFPP